MASDVHSKAQTLASQDKFLDAYRQLGNITAAAQLSGVGRRTHYDWIEQDDEYAQRFADSTEEAADRLEIEARRRAVQGVKEDILYKGRVVGTKKTFSDTLLIFLLKGARPDKYKDRLEHSGSKAAPIQVQSSSVDLRFATEEELAAFEALNLAIAERAIKAAATAKAQLPTPNSPAPSPQGDGDHS